MGGFLSQLAGMKMQKEQRAFNDQIGLYQTVLQQAAKDPDSVQPGTYEAAVNAISALADSQLGGGGKGQGGKGKGGGIGDLFKGLLTMGGYNIYKNRSRQLTGQANASQQARQGFQQATGGKIMLSPEERATVLQKQEEAKTKILAERDAAIEKGKREADFAFDTNPVKHQIVQEMRKRDAKDAGITEGTPAYIELMTGIKPAAQRAGAEPKLMELKGPNGEKVTGLYSPENGPMTVTRKPLPNYIPVIKDPEAVTSGGSEAKVKDERALAAYREKHGIPAGQKLTATQEQSAIAEGAAATETPDVKATRELTLAMKQEALAKAREERNATPQDIKPGTREFRVAQDLAYGKLTMTQFRSMIAYSRDVNKKLDIYDKAAELNPNFNPAAFEMGFRLAENPRVQQQLASLDNVKSGVDSLLDASDKASRTGVTILNKAIMKGGIMVGGKRYSDFATARTAFADELSGALGYGSATDMSREMGFDMTNPNLSPDNFRSAVEGIVIPFVDRKKASLLKQMGVYGQPGMNPAAVGSTNDKDPLGILK